MPSPMRQELKAAIERVLAYACLSSRLQDAKACDIVRAYLEQFDEEWDFMEAAMKLARMRREGEAIRAEIEKREKRLGEAIQSTYEWSEYGRKYKREADDLKEKELGELRAEVREWLCVGCNTVYPGPPREGYACVQCPECSGDCGPRGFMELRDLKAKIVKEREAVRKVAEELSLCIYPGKRNVSDMQAWAARLREAIGDE